ncbi:hypothetical protein OROHE_018904 [Orobanche hederae]
MADSWATACINDLHGLKPALLMVLVQSLYALVNVVCKLAANDGMSVSVLVAYRLMFGAASIAPVAFLAEREKEAKVNMEDSHVDVSRWFIRGITGADLILEKFGSDFSYFYLCHDQSYSSYYIHHGHLFEGLEKPKLNSAAGKARVLGTIMGMGGATILTLYKGPYLNIWTTNINLLEITTSHPHTNGHGGQNFVLGSLLAFATCVCYSLWLIVQREM